VNIHGVVNGNESVPKPKGRQDSGLGLSNIFIQEGLYISTRSFGAFVVSHHAIRDH